MSKRPPNKRRLKIPSMTYYNQLTSAFPHYCYVNSFHSAQKVHDKKLPSQNDFQVRSTTLTASLPYPLCNPVVADSLSDSCLHLLHEKERYAKKLTYCQRLYEQDKKWLKTQIFQKEALTKLPEYFVEVATDKISDVDPYFDCDYDYYYTGGNLRGINLKGDLYLVRPVPSNQICFTNVSKPNVNYFLNTDNKSVYNILTYNYDNRNYLTIRQKHTLTLYNYDLIADALETKKVWVKKSDTVPFIDCKSLDKHKIGYMNVNAKFFIDTVDGHNIFSYQFPVNNEKPGLSQFEALDENQIFCMTMEDVHIFDRRSRSNKTHTIKKGFFLCNNLSSYTRSTLENHYIYLTTRHEIYKFDTRQMAVVTKWSNMLSQAPIVTKSTAFGRDEILLTSNFSETSCLYVSDYENYLPFRMPHPRETLNEVTLVRGKIADCFTEKRIRLSISGIEAVANSKYSTTLYTTNSIGDIFCSHLTNHTTANQNNINSADEMIKWLRKIPPRSTQLKPTSFQEMSAMKKLLQNSPEDGSSKADIYSCSNARLSKLMGSLQDASKYNMASIWLGGSVNLGENGVDLLKPITPNHKVAEWLEKNKGEEM